MDLLLNAIVAGVLLGGFYAAVTVGISISFGMLDVVNIAHPAFIIVGAYIAYIVNATFGLDPILTAILVLPAFYLLGQAVYQVFYLSFEKRGEEALRGLAFFFGLLFITEVVLILVFGVDYRYVHAAYIGPTWRIGFVDFPLRMLTPCVVSLLLVAALQLFLSRTFIGRAIMAVAQDQQALRLLSVDPIRIKRIAFGISIATAALAGAFLIIIQPIEPSVGPRVHRPHLRHLRAGRHGQPAGHRDRGHAARRHRELHGHLLRALVGARGRLRLPADHAGRQAGRLLGR